MQTLKTQLFSSRIYIQEVESGSAVLATFTPVSCPPYFQVPFSCPLPPSRFPLPKHPFKITLQWYTGCQHFPSLLLPGSRPPNFFQITQNVTPGFHTFIFPVPVPSLPVPVPIFNSRFRHPLIHGFPPSLHPLKYTTW